MHAPQFAFLVDGEEYFRAVREALLQAQRSIFILGWDIDSRQQLVPGAPDDGWPEQVGNLLNALVSRRRGLRAYVLTSDFAMLYLLEREWMPGTFVGRSDGCPSGGPMAGSAEPDGELVLMARW